MISLGDLKVHFFAGPMAGKSGQGDLFYTYGKAFANRDPRTNEEDKTEFLAYATICILLPADGGLPFMEENVGLANIFQSMPHVAEDIRTVLAVITNSRAYVKDKGLALGSEESAFFFIHFKDCCDAIIFALATPFAATKFVVQLFNYLTDANTERFRQGPSRAPAAALSAGPGSFRPANPQMWMSMLFNCVHPKAHMSDSQPMPGAMWTDLLQFGASNGDGSTGLINLPEGRNGARLAEGAAERADTFTGLDRSAVETELDNNKKLYIVPFFFLNAARVFRLEFMVANFRDAICLSPDYAVQDADGELLSKSIFGVDDNGKGLIRVRNLPDGVEMFQMSAEHLTAQYLFPNVFPSPKVLREQIRDPALCAMSDDELLQYVKYEILGQTNPARSGNLKVHQNEEGRFAMGYMKTAGDLVKKMLSTGKIPNTDEFDGEQLRQYAAVNIMSRVVHTMANDTTNTPRGAREIALSVIAGLDKVGIGFIPLENRLCDSAAHVVQVIDWFRKVGAITFEREVGLRVLWAAVANLLTTEHLVNFHIFSPPGQGKTYFINNLVAPFLANFVRVADFTAQGVNSSSAAWLLAWAIVFIDEVNPNIFETMGGIERLKQMLGGNSGGAERVTNSDFDDPTLPDKGRQVLVSNVGGFVWTANRPLAEICKGLERGNVEKKSGLVDRFHEVAVKDNAPLPIPERAPDQGAREAALSQGRFLMSVCQLCALFMQFGILQPPSTTVYEPLFALLEEKVLQAYSGIALRERKRLQASIRMLAFADCIIENVFERLCCATGDATAAASLSDLMLLIYDASISCCLKESNFLFAASVVLDSEKATADEDAICNELIDNLHQNSYNRCSDGAGNDSFRITSEKIKLAAHEMGVCPDMLESCLKRNLTAMVIAKPTPHSVVPGQPPVPARPARYAASVRQEDGIKGREVVLVDALYFKNVIHRGTPFDSYLARTVKEMSELDTSDPAFVNVQEPKEGFISVPLHELVTRLFDFFEFKQHSDDQEKSHVWNFFLLPRLYHRMNLGFIEVHDLFRNVMPTWKKICETREESPALKLLESHYLAHCDGSSSRASQLGQVMQSAAFSGCDLYFITPKRGEPRMIEAVSSFVLDSRTLTATVPTGKSTVIDSRCVGDFDLMERLVRCARLKPNVDVVSRHLFRILPDHSDLKRRYCLTNIRQARVQDDCPQLANVTFAGSASAREPIDARDYVASLFAEVFPGDQLHAQAAPASPTPSLNASARCVHTGVRESVQAASAAGHVRALSRTPPGQRSAAHVPKRLKVFREQESSEEQDDDSALDALSLTSGSPRYYYNGMHDAAQSATDDEDQDRRAMDQDAEQESRDECTFLDGEAREDGDDDDD